MGLKKGLRYPCELLRKAIKLIQQNQIRKISSSLFIVRGTHQNPLGYYTVEKLESGVWICNCDGFKKRKAAICSHIIAVMVLQSCERAEKSQRARLEGSESEVLGFG